MSRDSSTTSQFTKRAAPWLAALLGVAILGCSSTKQWPEPDPLIYHYSGTDAAKLIVFRKDDSVAEPGKPDAAQSIRIGEDIVGKLPDQRFIELSMRPGAYRLLVDGNTSQEHAFTLAAGIAHYVRLNMRPGITSEFTLRRCGETSDTVKVCKDPVWRFDPSFMSMPADEAHATLASLPASE